MSLVIEALVLAGLMLLVGPFILWFLDRKFVHIPGEPPEDEE